MNETTLAFKIGARTETVQVPAENLLGILEPNEAIILSTHLLEEVEHFVSRAALLREGKLVGDVSALDLEEQGKSLLDFVKETYRYEPDRVSRALEKLTEDEEERP